MRGENVPRCSLKTKIRQVVVARVQKNKKKNKKTTKPWSNTLPCGPRTFAEQTYRTQHLRFRVFTSIKLRHSCTGIISRLRQNRTLQSNQTGWNSRSNLDSIKHNLMASLSNVSRPACTAWLNHKANCEAFSLHQQCRLRWILNRIWTNHALFFRVALALRLPIGLYAAAGRPHLMNTAAAVWASCADGLILILVSGFLEIM